MRFFIEAIKKTQNVHFIATLVCETIPVIILKQKFIIHRDAKMFALSSSHG